MIFPIGDTQVERGYYPWVSYCLLAFNILIFILQVFSPGMLICQYGLIPEHIAQGNGLLSLLSSMFMHGGILHLAGNMLFLWIFADNIEATIGSTKFALFYLGGGLAASLLHIYFSVGPEDTLNCCKPCLSAMGCAGEDVTACSGSVPTVGASGAISAVMGAYMVMFPKSKIKVLFFIKVIYVSALFFLALWFVGQLYSGIMGNITGSTEGVAWWAHIGGFIAGVIFGYFYKDQVHLHHN